MPEIDITQFLIFYAILLFSLSFHEAAHAITAKWGGDMLSAYQGRISMNPLVHIDPVGTVLMPALQFFTGLPLIGWAKPVPVNAMKFKRQNYEVVVALAGPFSNLLLAAAGILALGLLKFLLQWFPALTDSAGTLQALFALMSFLQSFIMLNILLMVFNLTPVPPLDGSHVLWHLFIKPRPRLHNAYFAVAPYGFVILLLLLILPPYRWIIGFSSGIISGLLQLIFGGMTL